MPQKFNLASGVDGLFIEDSRFNTTLISFNFYVPLRKETYSDYALLPYLLSSCCDECKTFRELNTRLGNLYGATISANTIKLLDFQCISVSLSVLNDRFSIDGKSIVASAAELLASLVFAPSLSDDAFREADVERERAQMLDRIRGEINNKRGYARGRALSLMFGDDPYGLPRFGTEEDLMKVTGKSLFSAWSRMLREAYVHINVIGEKLPEGIFSAASAAFSAIHRENVTAFSGYNMPNFAEPTTECERMDVKQGKLVMGFSLGRVDSEKNTSDIMVMSDIFGGGPYSRLFTHVREKLSLCYYCSCTALRSKAIMLVDSGVEAENAEKAQKEILGQLEVMKNGEFSDDQFNSSIRSICDSLKSIGDSQGGINAWYASRVFDDSVATPEDVIETVKKVTREEVMAAAKQVTLHTVYSLMPQEDAK
ncbi:MAG: insulinase family protein [Clostridia bacterium]|nr:insulinase family protein [Clostridia bacterium]